MSSSILTSSILIIVPFHTVLPFLLSFLSHETGPKNIDWQQDLCILSSKVNFCDNMRPNIYGKSCIWSTLHDSISLCWWKPINNTISYDTMQPPHLVTKQLLHLFQTLFQDFFSIWHMKESHWQC